MHGEFSVFYASCKDDVLRAMVLATGDRAGAEDAAAEAFARAYARWSRLSDHPKPQAWVMRTALNVYRSWWRTFRREAAAAVTDAAADDPSLLLQPDLVRAVRGLPLRQREVVALRLVLDLDTAQTAAALNIAAGTVTAHLHRATTALRAVLDESTIRGVDR